MALAADLKDEINEALEDERTTDLDQFSMNKQRENKVKSRFNQRQSKYNNNQQKKKDKNPWEEQDLTGLIEFTTFITDVIEIMKNHTTAYDHVDIEKINNYGCWCQKFGSGESIGGKSVDEFDEICKDWYKKRRCLKLVGGSCKGAKVLKNYYTKFDNGELYDDENDGQGW